MEKSHKGFIKLGKGVESELDTIYREMAKECVLPCAFRTCVTAYSGTRIAKKLYEDVMAMSAARRRWHAASRWTPAEPLS